MFYKNFYSICLASKQREKFTKKDGRFFCGGKVNAILSVLYIYFFYMFCTHYNTTQRKHIHTPPKFFFFLIVMEHFCSIFLSVVKLNKSVLLDKVVVIQLLLFYSAKYQNHPPKIHIGQAIILYLLLFFFLITPLAWMHMCGCHEYIII